MLQERENLTPEREAAKIGNGFPKPFEGDWLPTETGFKRSCCGERDCSGCQAHNFIGNQG
jgi:hypothetical protein